MDSSKIQIVKVVAGGVLSLATLGAFVFLRGKGIELSQVEITALLVGIVGPATVAGHGLFKMDPNEEK
jgi:hypothetical protein